MKLSWSHAVLYVKDQDTMIDFYTNTLGFTVTDRGPIGPDGAPEIIFMSSDPNEHHQIAMIQTRKDEGPSNAVNHFAFRVESFADVKNLNTTLQEMEGINIMPLSHGNTLSVYFNDPEQNGIEVFWDTPWHVAQPQGKPWDPSLEEAEALDWVKENFSGEPTFEPRNDYYQNKHLQ